MKERPVLFLDVDGVLNTVGNFGSLMSNQTWFITEIHNETSCDVVIESMWRENEKQLKRLLRCLLATIPRRYISLTPFLDEIFNSIPERKSAEISQWLIQNRPWGFGNFIILDDEPIPRYEEKQILVQPVVGLIRSVSEQTILKLQCQEYIT